MDEHETDTHELSGSSPEFRTQLAKQLEKLVPEAIADGKVDVAKLKELLQEDAGDTNERFGLFWPGKKRAMRAAQEPTTATLKPAKELSKEWDTTQNIFIEGDNLEVLKVLQKQYHNSISMIYIDPPYNTGRDFIYPDNFKEGLANYLEFSKQVDEGNKKISTNTEVVGRYHSNWLNMMYPRLKLARNLLTDDGVIFISIDDSEQANLKRICDEIFGEDNFIATIVVESGEVYGTKASHTDKTFVKVKDYILAYARNVKAGAPRLPLYDESRELFDTHYSTYIDKHDDEYSTSTLVSHLKDQTWICKVFEDSGLAVNASNLNKVMRFNDKIREYIYSIANHLYADQPYAKKVSEEFLSGVTINTPFELDGRLLFKSSTGSVRMYISFSDALRVSDDYKPAFSRTTARGDLWKNFHIDMRNVQDEGGVDYKNGKKPVRLIKNLAKWVNHQDSVVLDFFSGSGTTAHAIMQLNAEDGGTRKHIQVQLPEPIDPKNEAYKAGYRKISDIARARIDKAGEAIKEKFADKITERETLFDAGYRTYQLSDTNFRKWQSSATNDLGELQARLDLMRESADDDASEEDLLVEVTLKMGLPLTSRIATREVASLTVYQVVPADEEHADVQPVFYLNEHVKPTLEQLRAIVTELTPSKFVILDDAFQGDNQLKTNLVQTCKSYDVELWTV